MPALTLCAMPETTPHTHADGDLARPTSSETLSALLRSAFRDAGDVAKLRDAVCRYVDAARARGEPVERVIVDLKQEMRAAGAIKDYAAKEERALAEGVIRWCIERYYGAASARTDDT